MSRDPLQFDSPHEERDFWIFEAKVFIREAERRRGTSFATTLLEWAANARRRAAAIDVRAKQGDLFT